MNRSGLTENSIKTVKASYTFSVINSLVGEMLTKKWLEVLKMHFQDELGILQIAKEKGLSRQAAGILSHLRLCKV